MLVPSFIIVKSADYLFKLSISDLGYFVATIVLSIILGGPASFSDQNKILETEYKFSRKEKVCIKAIVYTVLSIGLIIALYLWMSYEY